MTSTQETPVLTDSSERTEFPSNPRTEGAVRACGEPRDCADLYEEGSTTSGVYCITLQNSTRVGVYCDMDTDGGGWTVIQRRIDGTVPFNRPWADYKRGFGNKSGEHWLGNDNIHLLTNQRAYRLRIVMSPPQGKQQSFTCTRGYFK
ncbi:angiopoietin-2-like [Branchiostoma floridae]|uniref:Angiopoietin-2-like n=1 Tax=Branchiostoma floridae TaxID=7739 RepID=A0A9J7LX30_BRAFL|nr:angiopoietin-2-like [Branchiostoma floridae]